jgi:hypothetical protein
MELSDYKTELADSMKDYSTGSTNKSSKSELAAYNAKKVRHLGLNKIWETLTDYNYKI